MSQADRFNRVSRRWVLGASGAAGIGTLGLVLAACSSSNNNNTKAAGTKPSGAATTAPGAAAASSSGQELIVAQAALFTTLEQQFADALGAMFPAALHEIAMSEAYGAVKYKVIQRCQATGETPRQVLATVSARDRAFVPNANDPAAFLASRIEG